jgi:hypothetical protein
MTDYDECICSHSLDQHNEALGYCEANNCKCVVYRSVDEEAEDEEDLDADELDFDHDER